MQNKEKIFKLETKIFASVCILPFLWLKEGQIVRVCSVSENKKKYILIINFSNDYEWVLFDKNSKTDTLLKEMIMINSEGMYSENSIKQIVSEFNKKGKSLGTSDIKILIK